MEDPKNCAVVGVNETPDRDHDQSRSGGATANSSPSDDGGADSIRDQSVEVDLEGHSESEEKRRGATSTQQVEANCANALRSTGPRSVQGKRRSALNALKHGGYGGSVAIPRGILAESEHQVEEFVEAIVESLGPRDAAELVVAKRVALADLRLARLDRYEGVSLAKIGRVQPQFGEADNQSVELAIDCAVAASQLSRILAGEPDSRLSLDLWQSCAQIIWNLHKAPLVARVGPEDVDDCEIALEAWRQFVLDDLIPTYWRSAAAASSALENEAKRWTDFHLAVEGKAEERAVTGAISRDGPMDRLTILRARIQREGDRDRVNFVKLQERILMDDEAFEEETGVAQC